MANNFVGAFAVARDDFIGADDRNEFCAVAMAVVGCM
jgi:hypothetical protein